MALGHKSELERGELRNLFPIIQRLLWTKWALWQIFVNALERAMPTWYIFVNNARPSKKNRCLLYCLMVTVIMLFSCISLAGPAPVDEEYEAGSKPLWTLFGELLSMP